MPPESVDPALRLLAERNLPAWVCGAIAAGEGAALYGEYPAAG